MPGAFFVERGPAWQHTFAAALLVKGQEPFRLDDKAPIRGALQHPQRKNRVANQKNVSAFGLSERRQLA